MDTDKVSIMCSSLKLSEGVEVYYFGIDFLRLNFSGDFKSVYLDSFFTGLSANSNTKRNVTFFSHPFDIQYIETRNKKIVLFEFAGDSVIELVKILDGGAADNTSFVVSFYATFFYIPEICRVLELFSLKFSNSLKVTRLDLCLDVNVSVHDLWYYHSTKFRKKTPFFNGEAVETFYLGAKANNKRYYLRVYDKKLDTQKKDKFHIFGSYSGLAVVSRIEAQCNVNACREFKFTLKQCLDFLKTNSFENSELWDVFKFLIMNEKTTLFSHFKNNKFKFIRLSSQKNGLVLDDLGYAKTMLGYAKRLNAQGFNVLKYLSERLPAMPSAIENR